MNLLAVSSKHIMYIMCRFLSKMQDSSIFRLVPEEMHDEIFPCIHSRAVSLLSSDDSFQPSFPIMFHISASEADMYVCYETHL